MVQNEKLNKKIRKAPFINQKYKDSLFRIAFREKEKLLELYNAIHGSDYKDSSELTVYTMEDVVFMGIKNDISFLVGEMLNLYEQQSTENPNMPIRGLLYFAGNYRSYIAKNDLDIYSRTLQKLPFPQYYVLYNGLKDEEDRKVLELKDAFPELEGLEPCLNCRAVLLNINYGHNREIMERSRTLRDYSVYVQRIRDNKSAGMGLLDAVDKATEDCIKEGILKDILIKNISEVKEMVLGAWGTENHIRKQNEKLKELEHKTNELEKKATGLEKRNARLEERNAGLEERNAGLEERNAGLEEKNIGLKERNIGLEERNVGLEEENAKLRQEANKLKKERDLDNKLIQNLLNSRRIEELQKVLVDDVYRQELLNEIYLISRNEK